MPLIDPLKWENLTATVNLIKPPASFLRNLLFNRHQTVETEVINFDELTGGRVVAPFVRRDSEAVMVAGLGFQSRSVQPTNIRIKRPFTPSSLLYNRLPGTTILNPGVTKTRAVREHIARDLKYMSDQVVNAEEWLCSQALQGTISYSVADQDNFTITFPRQSSHNITLTDFWDDDTDHNEHGDFLTVKSLFSEEGMRCTDVLLGSTAAAQFVERVAAKEIVLSNDNGSALSAGAVTLMEAFQDNGAYYLGNLQGIRVWGYERSMTLNGSSVDLIRPKYAEFFSVDNSVSDRVLYYGAIPDMAAFQGGLMQTERFSKAWEIEDPSAIISLLHTRPLPVPRKPNATISMKVIT